LSRLSRLSRFEQVGNMEAVVKHKKNGDKFELSNLTPFLPLRFKSRLANIQLILGKNLF